MVKFNSTSQFENENNFFMGARYTYVPTSVNAEGSAWGIRKKVWKFKDGDIETTAETALWVARTLEENISLLDTCTFVCIPASDATRNEMRYRTNYHPRARARSRSFWHPPTPFPAFPSGRARRAPAP